MYLRCRKYKLLKVFIPLLWLLCGSSTDLFSQGNTVIRYTAEDGVCSALMLNTIRDNRGRIWFASYGQDLSVFDGRSWTCLKLPPYNLNAFHLDKKGYIWLDFDKGALRRIVNDKIIPVMFPSGSSYRFFMIGRTPYCIDETTFSIFEYNYVSGHFMKVTGKTYKSELEGFNVFDCKSTEESAVCYFKNKQGIIKIFKIDSKLNFNFLEVTREVKRGNRFYSSDFKSCFIQLADKIVQYKQGKLTHIPLPLQENFTGKKVAYNAQIYKILRDGATSHLYMFWKIANQKRFILQEYDNEFSLINQVVYWSNLEPFGCSKDYAGNYWLATESYVQKILTYQYIIDRNTSSIPSQIWAVTEAQDGMMWFGSYGKGIVRFDGEEVLGQPTALDRLGDARYDDVALKDQNGNLLFNLENAYNKEKGWRFGPGIIQVSPENRIEYIPTKNAAFFWGNNRSGNLLRGVCCQQGLAVYKNHNTLSDTAISFSIDPSKGLKLSNVLTAIEDKYNRYWMAMPSQGISMYDPRADTVINWLINEDERNIGSMTIDQDYMGNLWIGGIDGLYFFKNRTDIKPGFSLRKYLQKVGDDYLGAKQIYTVKVINPNTLLVGNKIGYFLMDIAAFYKGNGSTRFRGVFTIKNKNYTGGAVGQNAAWVARDGSLWMTTSEGIVRHHSERYNSSISAESVTIDSFCVGSLCLRNEDFQETIALNSHQNSITIYFHHEIDSLLGENTFFRYRINHGEWSSLFKEPFVKIQNLAPGRYKFEIKTVKNGYESDVKSVSFVINKLLLRNPAFWLPIGVVMFGLGIYLYQRQKIIYRQKLTLSEKEVEVKLMSKEKDMLHLQAIVNQLNPHFINNALQWLQIRVDDDPEAVKLIGKLSDNIRTIFHNSRNKVNFHSLESEITLTENYLFIQKCRFGKRLNHTVSEKEKWQNISKVNVPMMIIQIHVENAIEHGIRNKDEGNGTVSIEIIEQKAFIQILIKDDGVGRAAASKIGSKGTQNGTKMLKEIEQILNKKNKLKISQTYHDGIYIDTEGNKYGTCVELLVPKEFDYIIDS